MNVANFRLFVAEEAAVSYRLQAGSDRAGVLGARRRDPGLASVVPGILAWGFLGAGAASA